ncbi:MAG TPA: hypothetical protein VHY32_04040 [Caulobacteraceae bacterium]|nr:hypothetical protein [Caulobacteraceae bacterium]
MADRKNGTVLCAYRELIGRFSLPTTVNLGPKLRIQHLRFAFRQGRLMRVDYQVSVNAFDDVTARLTQRYGPPAKLIHDDVKTELGAFPRIRQVWVTSSAWIELVDPVAPFNQMGVELTIKPAATGRKAS